MRLPWPDVTNPYTERPLCSKINGAQNCNCHATSRRLPQMPRSVYAGRGTFFTRGKTMERKTNQIESWKG
jgi:hypothetical protein